MSEPTSTLEPKRREPAKPQGALPPEPQEEVTLTLERIEQILTHPLPPAAYEEHAWWANQAQGLQVETIPWMDAGWLVEMVDLDEKWVRFVRQ